MTYFLFTYSKTTQTVKVKAITDKKYMLLQSKKFADNVLNEYLFYKLISLPEIKLDYTEVQRGTKTNC